MNQYDEQNMREISTISDNKGRLYRNITDAKPIKMHGTRFLLFKHTWESGKVVPTALAMSSIGEITFKESLV